MENITLSRTWQRIPQSIVGDPREEGLAPTCKTLIYIEICMAQLAVNIAHLIMASGITSVKSSSKLRVLVVDDHELVRDGIVSILKDRWDICGEDGNGVEAIQKTRDLRPDLVLLDLSMPVMSGTEAAKSIRAVAPATKIIFISIHDSPTIADLVRIAGADGFVSKHSRADEFRTTLASLLHVSPA